MPAGVALAGLGLSAVLAVGLPPGLLALDRIFPPDLTRLDGLSRAVVDRDGNWERGREDTVQTVDALMNTAAEPTVPRA